MILELVKDSLKFSQNQRIQVYKRLQVAKADGKRPWFAQSGETPQSGASHLRKENLPRVG